MILSPTSEIGQNHQHNAVTNVTVTQSDFYKPTQCRNLRTLCQCVTGFKNDDQMKSQPSFISNDVWM